jgi:AcrR family transcriptional regulator
VTASRPLRADARRNREAVLDAAGELFGSRGDTVGMEEVAQRAGVGVGTVYRHFADKGALRAAIVGRRFEAVTEVARRAGTLADPWDAFEALVVGYLESVEPDAGFRMTLLGPDRPDWSRVDAEKSEFSAVVDRILERAVTAGVLRADFRAEDFVLVTRGALANMGGGDWRRHLTLLLDGVRGPVR